jgi:hypothetical protein
VDLFEPSSGSQVHDFNGGTLPSGLLWTLPVDHDGVRFSHHGHRARLRIHDMPVIDQFPGAFRTPATIDLEIEWDANAPFVAHGSGTSVPPTDGAAFLGAYAPADATGRFAGSEFGFEFESNRGANAKRGFALIGHVRNGSQL